MVQSINFYGINALQTLCRLLTFNRLTSWLLTTKKLVEKTDCLSLQSKAIISFLFLRSVHNFSSCTSIIRQIFRISIIFYLILLSSALLFVFLIINILSKGYTVQKGKWWGNKERFDNQRVKRISWNFVLISAYTCHPTTNNEMKLASLNSLQKLFLS